MESKEEYNVVRIDDLRTLGSILAASGYFADARDEAKAVVKVLAGQELGIGPIAAMSGIHIINGKPAVGSALLAALVKRSGRYNFRVKELNDTVCEIEFFERNADGKFECIGVSSFTEADAKRAGTQNMGRFPRNMLYARAMSNGVKWFCPDITTGPIYEPGELGATVDYETGEIIESQAVEIKDEPESSIQEPSVSAPSATVSNGHIAKNGGYGKRPWNGATLRDYLQQRARELEVSSDTWAAPAPGALCKTLINTFDELVNGNTQARDALFTALTGRLSARDISYAMAKKLIDWANSDPELAAEEAKRILLET